ncbi:flagellar hook capping FlgD N-terminal domain-containing protein [Sulfitobacter sp. JB4-11]|uniref:flagellar hook capping FlgD N-terminal domain-containing protein n=1 Tax=Sulfitobacter rhodophyticola TaxID=3238304 RepID=UPI003D818C1E
MEITPSPAPTAAVRPAQTGINLSSDFETFIKLLTTQAENQDPLEPIDATEYAAQLAQFSMVEQQVKSNDILTALSTQLGAGNMAQLASWIGMEARSTTPAFFDGNPISVASKPAPNADEVVLVVTDSRGTEVQRNALPVAAQEVVWAGVSSDGAPFPAGQYSFAIESRRAGEVIGTAPAQTYARITEARIEQGETVLITEGGGTLRTDDVTGLRAPGASPV